MLVSIVLVLGLALEICASSLTAKRFGIKPKYRRDKGLRQSNFLKRNAGGRSGMASRSTEVAPKIFIISMFDSEAGSWLENMPDLYAMNITVPGFSPLYPEAHCDSKGEVCQLTTGEGEINAASSISALLYSGLFKLTKTYFMVAGIAGVNPHVASTGSVTFARYAVQFDLQYEFDARQIPSNDSTGYFPQNGYYPDTPNPIDYPQEIYGTEVFELNVNLRDRAVYLAKLAKLNDTDGAASYRKAYASPGNKAPFIVKCDTGTSNVYFSGSVLGDAFANYTKLLTNGTGEYCATQQEDNATLEALLRGTLAGKVDFSRVIVMRTCSDYDRAPPDEDEVFHLLYADQEGFEPSIDNLFLAGIEIVKDVILYWDSTYLPGIAPGNYIGDAFNSLNSTVAPDIGTEAIYIN